MITDEVKAAIDTLIAAWAPRLAAARAEPHDGAHDDDDGYDDETNGCGCGGSRVDEDGEPIDDDGEPYCNCGGGCVCKSCNHYRHAETRLCHLRVPQEGQPYAWCGRPSRYRVTPFCVHRDGVTRSADEGDPAADHHGHVRLGDSTQRHTATYACSTEHARTLVDQDRQHRSGRDPDSALSAQSTFYEVERFDYEPDDTDVPASVIRVGDALASARFRAGRLATHLYAGDRRGTDYYLEGVRLSVIETLLTLLDVDRDLTEQADEEGADL